MIALDRFLSWWMDAMGYTYTDPPAPVPHDVIEGPSEMGGTGYVHLYPAGPALEDQSAMDPPPWEPVQYPPLPPDFDLDETHESRLADRIMAEWAPIPDEDEPIP